MIFKWKIGPEGPDFADFEQKLGIFNFFLNGNFGASKKRFFLNFGQILKKNTAYDLIPENFG